MNFRSRIKLAGTIARVMRSQWWPGDRIAAYQSEKLRSILTHALRKIPHYRESMPLDVLEDCMEMLHRFPVMDKSQLQDDPDRFRWPAIPLNTLHRSRSSGSTGEPTTTYFDQDAWLLSKYALKARRVLNAAAPVGQRILVVSEADDNTHDTLRHVSIARWLFSTMTITVEDSIDENIARLLDFQPTMIYGYPSYLAYLAEAVLNTGRRLPQIPVIFTSSELLTPTERGELESHYGGRVTDVYGSTEFKEIAVQCVEGRYHLNFESVYIESVPDTGHPRVLITSLVNRAMPLIRFDIGDYANLDQRPCPCGRNGPYLQQPHGRAAEMLRFPNGVAVTSFALTTTVGAFAEVRNYSIIHAAPERIRILVYSDPELSADRQAKLVDKVKEKLPAGVIVTIEPLDHRLPAGKRIAVSRAF